MLDFSQDSPPPEHLYPPEDYGRRLRDPCAVVPISRMSQVLEPASRVVWMEPVRVRIEGCPQEVVEAGRGAAS